MRFDFSQIAFQDALEHVVLGTLDERRADGEWESSTAVLEVEEPVYTPSPHVEHEAAD